MSGPKIDSNARLQQCYIKYAQQFRKPGSIRLHRNDEHLLLFCLTLYQCFNRISVKEG